MAKFKSKYLLRIILHQDLNPFTGFKIKICDDYLEIKQRNWYIISVDTDNIYFKNLIGVVIDKHLIGADIIFRLKGDNNFIAWGFSKKTANKIQAIVKTNIKNIDVRSNDKLLRGIQNTIKTENSNNSNSVLQELRELKNLFDDDVLTQEEFNQQKSIILNQD